MSRFNVAVVGAGIVGIAHAWSAAERGHRVTLFERGSRANGASIRNFGMIWPIGQPAGEMHDLALASSDKWLQRASEAGIWVNPCGSIHLAHRPDEWSVLEEFHAKSRDLGYDCSLLSADEVLARSPAANPSDLLGGLYNPTELCVNPRNAVREFPAWLARRYDVRLAFGTNVVQISSSGAPSAGVELRTSRKTAEHFDLVVVCGGVEFQTLFPELFAQSGLKLCKLQMLKTRTQPGGWRLGPHLAGGLTLRHYQNFSVCPSLEPLKQRIARESPELDRYGIHVMASQNDAGEIILGDSHEYDSDVDPFDKMIIDNLILDELRKVIRLPDWTIVERWHGIYSKHPTAQAFEAEPLPNVHICTGTGGAGMTNAFGIAERAWSRFSCPL